MIFLAAGLVVIVLCWLHSRSLNAQRQTFEDRLDGQAQRHAQDLRKLIDASAAERSDWQRTLERQHTALLAQLEAERKTAADERVQLLNRIKPDTYHPPISQTEAVSTPPAVGFDDDDGFWRASESRDDMVARIERDLQAARVS